MTWHFRITRRLRLFLETALVLLMLMGAAIGWGAWHLSQGPVDLKPVLPALTRMFHSWLPGMTYTIGDASLEWGGQQSPFILRIRDIGFISPRGRQIGKIAEIAASLAPNALLAGQIAPTSLDIASPAMTITRFPDGHLGLRFDRNAPDKDESDNALSITEITNLLKLEHYAFTTYLQRIMVSHIEVTYRDFITQQDSVTRDGRLLIERSAGNHLSGEGLLSLPVGDTLRPVTLDIHPDTARNLSLATIRLPALTNQDLQELAPNQTALSHFSGTIDTEINIGIDAAMQTRFIELAGKTDQATIVWPAAFADGLPLKTAQFAVMYDLETKNLTVHDTHIVMADATAHLTGQVNDPLDTTTPLHMTLQAELDNMPMGKLAAYWPANLAPSARAWVTEHINQGTAHKAIATVTADAPAVATHSDLAKTITVSDVKGTIDFTGLNTDYLPPMIPVTDIAGQALFNLHEFTIVPTSGTMRDTRVKSGTIKIAPLDGDNTDLDLTLLLDGPVQDALVLLADKPLEFTQRVGLTPQQVTGQAETTLHLQFPLINDLKLDQLTVKAAAELKNLTVRKAYRDADVAGDALHLAVDGKGLTLSGGARLSDAPLQSLNWDEFFGATADFRRQFAIKGQVTPRLLRDLRLDAGKMFADHALIDTKITEHINRDIVMTANADLTPATITVPDLNLAKPAGKTGHLSFDLTARANQPTVIQHLDVTMPGTVAKQATITLASDGTIQDLNIPHLVSGKTDASIKAVTLPRHKGWDATIRGKAVDLSGLWADKTQSSKDATQTRPPVKLKVNLQQLLLDADYPLTNVNGIFFVDNDTILQADLDAMANTTPLRLRFGPTKSGNRILDMTSPNAGDMLRALNITDSVQGGHLQMTGGSDASTPQQIRGTLVVEDFTMIKAPLLARLLNAFSFGGLLDLLNQKGLSFNRMQTGFIHQDKTIILKDGRMAGASLGLNFAGTINQRDNTVDLGGTIVPIEGINKLVSKIPLIGQILTGLKGEGLVAATYSLKGPSSNPSVSVNPLSVLTPGILRSIFFEKN